MASLSPCSSLTTASMLSRKQKFSVPSLKTNLNFLSRSISSVRLDSPKQPFFVPKFSQTDAPSLAEPEIEPTTEIEAITEVQPTVETSEAETKREEVFAVVMVSSPKNICVSIFFMLHFESSIVRDNFSCLWYLYLCFYVYLDWLSWYYDGFLRKKYFVWWKIKYFCHDPYGDFH